MILRDNELVKHTKRNWAMLSMKSVWGVAKLENLVSTISEKLGVGDDIKNHPLASIIL